MAEILCELKKKGSSSGVTTADVYYPPDVTLECDKKGTIAYCIWNSRQTIGTVSITKNGSIIASLPKNTSTKVIGGTTDVNAGDVINITSTSGINNLYESGCFTYIR